MSLLNLFEPKHFCRLRLIDATSSPVDYLLQGNLRQRKLRLAEHEAAKKAEVHSARQLEQRIEGRDRTKTTEKTSQTDASAPSYHGERIENSAITHQFENCVDAFRMEAADIA